jgi:D-threonate/D-erythronate kinase
MRPVTNAIDGGRAVAAMRSSGVIIADDLTGAADACVAFVMRGLSGAVMFEASKTGEALASPSLASGGVSGGAADVIAISTDSRGLPPSLAAERVAAALRAARAAFGRDHFQFKKIDSTLRGPVGAEIQAAMTAADASIAIVAPAYPAMGRIVDGGLLRTTGRGAMPDVDIVQRLREEGLEGCVNVMRHHDWHPALLAAQRHGGRVLVCDSVDQADLDAIAAAADGAFEGPLLWVGAAGLAHALAAHVTGVRLDAAVETGPARGLEGTIGMGRRRGGVRTMSIVFAIGSTHPVTVAQQQRLMHDAMPIAAAHVDDPLAIEQALAMRLDVMVTLPHDAAGAAVARLAALLISREQAAPGSCALVMSGGDTAARLCQALGAARIDLGGEVAPGIPWGTLSLAGSAPARSASAVSPAPRSEVRWPVVLKAGGFGNDDGLIRVRRFLMEQHER